MRKHRHSISLSNELSFRGFFEWKVKLLNCYLVWNMQKVDDHFSGPKAAVEIEERERSPAPATATADEGYTFKAIDIQAAQKASS